MEKGNHTHKNYAVEFLQMVVAGNIDEAYRKFINMEGKHHNHFFPAGFEDLKQGMKDNHVQFPNKKLTVKNVLEDGDIVAVHSHLVFKDGEPGLPTGQAGMTTFLLFRFDGEKIIEMWDCGQTIPADSPNKDGGF